MDDELILSELVSDEERDELGLRASDFLSAFACSFFFMISSLFDCFGLCGDFFGASPSFSRRSISLISSSSSYSYASIVCRLLDPSPDLGSIVASFSLSVLVGSPLYCTTKRPCDLMTLPATFSPRAIPNNLVFGAEYR